MKTIKKEDSSSFNKDFNKLLELIQRDDKFSESVAESFVTSLCETILHKRQVYFPHRDDYLLVLYWNRFSGEIKTVSIDNTSYLIVNESDFEWHDMISWFPLWSTTIKKLNNLKTFESKVGINLESVKDKKDLEDLKSQFSEFLKKMISSNLLKEQKIIFEAKQKDDYNYFFKKVDNVAYQYPLDLYSEEVRFETLWSRLKPFCKFIDSYLRSKVTTKKNYVSIYNLIFDSENKLKHPFNVFEQEFIDKTVSLNDFKRLLELSKEDSLAEKSYEFLLDLFQNGYRNGSSYFTVFFWNRFTGEIKKDYSSYKNKQLDDIPHYGRDYLSWIPFFATNLSEFFNSAAISKVFGSKNTDITVELIQENKNGLIEAIKKKIKTKLARDQKEMLSASSSNNWDFFLNKAGRGELYPIDVYPEEFQYDRFWAHTELFNDGANYLSYIPPTFNVNGRYYTQRISNLVVEFKDNGDVK